MSSQILTLNHFRDIDTEFRGRIRFICPDFLEPVDNHAVRPSLLLADTPLPQNAETHNPRHLPPLADKAIQQEISGRIYKAINELDSAKPEWNGLSFQKPQRTIQTTILLRRIIIDIPPNGPLAFHEVWNGYNQTVAIKKIANTATKQYETLGFIVEFVNGLPDNNEGSNLEIAGNVFMSYTMTNSVS